MAQTIRDQRELRQQKARLSQERARDALARIRALALETSDEDLARQAEAAQAIDWMRLGASLDGRIALQLLAAAADQAMPAEKYLTTGDAADALGVSINTLKKWVRLGLIRDAYRTEGGHLRIAAADVARVAQLDRELEQTPDVPPPALERPPAPWNR
jgi:excisionase family DNA binding protein